MNEEKILDVQVRRKNIDLALNYLEKQKIIDKKFHTYLSYYYKSFSNSNLDKIEDEIREISLNPVFAKNKYQQLVGMLNLETKENGDQRLETKYNAYTNEINNDIEIIDIEEDKKLIGVENLVEDNEKYVIMKYSDGTTDKIHNISKIDGEKLFELIKKEAPEHLKELFESIICEPQEEIQSEEIQSKEMGYNKTLGTHPGVGKTLSSIFKSEGFLNLMFFTFLTGISSGIIIMIVLNLLTK